MQQGESTHDKVRRLRTLNEGEKLSLIFTQQRKLGEIQERIEAFQCAHETGSCPLCRDKDLTIAQLQQQNEQLRQKLYSRSSERCDVPATWPQFRGSKSHILGPTPMRG